MGVIATLLPTAAHLQRLRTAIRDRHQVVACDDWGSLVQVCERQAVRVAVIDIFAGDRTNFDHVRQLKHHLPRVTLIAYVDFLPGRAHDLFDAGRQGMDGLVLADQDDAPRALLSLIERAESRSLGAIVRAALDEAGVDTTTRDAVLLAVTRAHERLSPEGLARLLALPRRTISERLANAGFPSPQRLLSWGRLIVAGHLLEDRHRSADRIAVALDYSSGSALRNVCQRYLRATPSEIRARGGAAYVLRTLLQEVGASDRAIALFEDNRPAGPDKEVAARLAVS
jgi:AraC-type DNA-binding domain-containing proteins